MSCETAAGLTGQEAHEALQRFLALPLARVRTIATFKTFFAGFSDPRVLEGWDRTIEGLRKAGVPEE